MGSRGLPVIAESPKKRATRLKYTMRIAYIASEASSAQDASAITARRRGRRGKLSRRRRAIHNGKPNIHTMESTLNGILIQEGTAEKMAGSIRVKTALVTTNGAKPMSRSLARQGVSRKND